MLYTDWSPCFKELEKIVKQLRFQTVFKVPYYSKDISVRTNEKGDIIYLRSSFKFKRSAGSLSTSIIGNTTAIYGNQAVMNHTIENYGYVELIFDNKLLRSLSVYDHNAGYGNSVGYSSSSGNIPIHHLYFTNIDLSINRFIHNDMFIDTIEDNDYVFMSDLGDGGDQIMYDDLIEKLNPLVERIRMW